jgi:hypothetical protein
VRADSALAYWDEQFGAIGAEFPEVRADQHHIDILCARFVLAPQQFDIAVGSNLFGDILSDLGPALTGTIALAPSANINPERKFPSMFEPVHGSAPDIAGTAHPAAASHRSAGPAPGRRGRGGSARWRRGGMTCNRVQTRRRISWHVIVPVALFALSPTVAEKFHLSGQPLAKVIRCFF